MLPDRGFVRVNSGEIVQLNCLKRFRWCKGGGLMAEVSGHASIEFSRRHAQAFLHKFGF